MDDDNIIDITTVAKPSRVDPEDAFRLYVAGGARSLRKVAHTLNIPESTVMAWSRRGRWSQRLRDLDSETLQGVAQSVVVATAAGSLRALRTLSEVMEDQEAPPIARVTAARAMLDQYTRVAHLVPQLLPPATDDDADLVESVSTPAGAVELLRQHRDTASRR